MQHPFFNPLRNFSFYLIAWTLIIMAHTMIVQYYSDSSLFLALFDSLLFNLSFAGFALGIWYAVHFMKMPEDNQGKIVMNHFAAIAIFLTIWISAGFFIMNLFTNDASYKEFLTASIPFRLLSGLLYYLVIVFFYYFYSYYLSLHENLIKTSELKAVVKETQLELLKNQMNPHFIFNSLNSISALTIIDPEKARLMIISLSAFLRYSLSQKPDQLIPFSEELENGMLYLSIEKMRFGDRLVIENNIDENTKEVMIPGMILQPILENAVKHGAYESLSSVKVSIEAKIENTFIFITVSNNYEAQGNKSGKGIGLKNIREKIYLMYGRSAELKIENTENFFSIKMHLPINRIKSE